MGDLVKKKKLDVYILPKRGSFGALPPDDSSASLFTVGAGGGAIPD
jgi:hypothetical protein